MDPHIKIPQLNEMLKSYALASGIIYLDYFTAMVDERQGLPQKYAEDGVHPTKEGYALMKVLAEEAIQEALNKS
jgi:lysophospholipase L1-like esterase